MNTTTRTVTHPRPTPRQPSPRRATVLELLIFFTISLAGFAGAVGIVQAFSFRDLHFEPRTAEPGAPATVHWRFFGLPVWQRRLPQIVDVKERTITTRGDFDPSDPHPASQVEVLTVFVDKDGHDALILRHTSHLRERFHMRDYLTGHGEPSAGLTVRETERWWASNPIGDLAGGVVGLLLGLAIGVFFIVGFFSALRVRLSGK